MGDLLLLEIWRFSTPEYCYILGILLPLELLPLPRLALLPALESGLFDPLKNLNFDSPLLFKISFNALDLDGDRLDALESDLPFVWSN